MKSLNTILNPTHQPFYYYNGEKVYLEIDKNSLLINLLSPKNQEEKQEFIQRLDPSEELIDWSKTLKISGENIEDRFLLLYFIAPPWEEVTQLDAVFLENPDI